MPRNPFWIAVSCILALIGLLPAFSSGASQTPREKVIYSFAGGTDGAQPMSDLSLDSSGNLYGTTSGGGTGTRCNGGCGTVFELQRTKDGWRKLVLHNFVWGDDGADPEAGVIFDKAGNLYGTSFGGGSDNVGTVFKLAPNSNGIWTESVLYTFTDGTDGGNPLGDLVFDAQGNLYGTASGGGTFENSCPLNGCGAVFELTPHADGSWTETTLHTFGGAPNDGAVPVAGIILDSAGSFYGTTSSGGGATCLRLNLGCGTIFKLEPGSGGTWKETVLYNFIKGDGFGIHPSGELFFDDVNHLLGLTQAGGDGLGTIFDLRKTPKSVAWQQNNPHIFYDKPDGSRPAGRLIVDAKDDLFGITSYGGVNGMGTIFELRRLVNGGRKEGTLYNFFGPPDGANPSAGLVSDSQGHFYGTTESGGTGTGCGNGCGTVYEVTP